MYVNPTENLNIYLCDLNVSMSLLRSVRNCEIFYGYFLGLTLDGSWACVEITSSGAGFLTKKEQYFLHEKKLQIWI